MYRVGQYDTMSMQIEEDDIVKIYQHNVYNVSSNLILQDEEVK